MKLRLTAAKRKPSWERWLQLTTNRNQYILIYTFLFITSVSKCYYSLNILLYDTPHTHHTHTYIYKLLFNPFRQRNFMNTCITFILSFFHIGSLCHFHSFYLLFILHYSSISSCTFFYPFNKPSSMGHATGWASCYYGPRDMLSFQLLWWICLFMR